jgi:hypothetical protein
MTDSGLPPELDIEILKRDAIAKTCRERARCLVTEIMSDDKLHEDEDVINVVIKQCTQAKLYDLRDVNAAGFFGSQIRGAVRSGLNTKSKTGSLLPMYLLVGEHGHQTNYAAPQHAWDALIDREAKRLSKHNVQFNQLVAEYQDKWGAQPKFTPMVGSAKGSSTGRAGVGSEEKLRRARSRSA